MAKPTKMTKVHQYAVADRLGVSRSTVSKVFSNRKDVSHAMRLRVMSAANEMGYEYGPQPEAERESQIPRIGVMVRLGPEAPSGYRSDFLESLSSYAFDAQIPLATHFVPSSVPAESLFNGSGLHAASLRKDHIDGMLMAGPWSEEALIKASQVLPCAALAFGEQHSSVDTAEPDTMGAMQKIVEHLKAFSHARLAFVGLCPEVYWSTERYAGFVAGCCSLGLENSTRGMAIPVDATSLWDPNANDAWKPVVSKAVDLIRNEGVTALVCSSDWTAYHVYAGLRDCGISVPADVSLTGFDDLEILTWGCPKITSIHIPRGMLARVAVGRLIQRISDSSAPAIRSLLSCDLVDNGTTARPAS